MGLSGFILVWAAAVPGELRDEYHLDFRGGRPLPPVLRPVIPKTIQWIRPDAEGLSIRLAANRPILAPVGLATSFAVRGDFEITASYQVLKAEAPESGFGVGVSLEIKKADPSPERGGVAWVVRTGGKEVVAWSRATEESGGKVRYKGGAIASSARGGRLRLRRTGRTLSYLLAEGTTGEDFREIHQDDFGTADLERVELQVVSGRKPYAIDARWLDFQVRSESLPNVAQPPSSGNAFWLAVAVAGAVILGGSIEGWRRWRRRQRLLQEKRTSSTRQMNKGHSQGTR